MMLPKLSAVPATPFYLYSEEVLENTITKAKALMPKNVEVHFALKSNHNFHVLQKFKKAGFGVDIVSGGELEYALDQGFEPSKIVFSGVGKTQDELKFAVESGVGLINVESVFELEDLIAVSRASEKKARFGLRLNPDVDAKTHPYIATGLKAHKFGIAFEDARRLKQVIKEASDCLDLKGLSMHIGSQIKDLSAIREASIKLLNEITEWKKDFPSLEVLDLGGGLGISYENPSEIANFEDYSKILNEVGSLWSKASGESGVIALELGRSLVAQAGFLFTKVIGVKENRGTHFAVVDASMTELMRPCLYQAYHEIVPYSKTQNSNEVKQVKYDIVGPVCESSDVLGRDRLLPELSKGDVLVICSAGAYGYVLSNVYNMRALPAEYWLSSGQSLVLSRAALSWKNLNQIIAKGES